MALRSFPRRLGRCERGAALVEFAIVLPFLLLVFAMTIECGRLMWTYQSAVAGVRDAARYLGRVTPSDICTSGESLASYVSNDALKAIVGGRIGTTGRVAFAHDVSFPDHVVSLSVVAEIDDCIEGTYRVAEVGVAVVTARVTIPFPFGHVFGLVGADLEPITTTITDRTRVFGS